MTGPNYEPRSETIMDGGGYKLSRGSIGLRKYVSFTLPVPPRLNHRLAVVNGRLIASRQDRSYKLLVHRLCSSYRITPLSGDVSVQIHWYRARKSGDIDNRWKALLDSLSGWAYQDDAQISQLLIHRHDTDPKRARIEVMVLQEGVAND